MARVSMQEIREKKGTFFMHPTDGKTKNRIFLLQLVLVYDTISYIVLEGGHTS